MRYSTRAGKIRTFLTCYAISKILLVLRRSSQHIPTTSNNCFLRQTGPRLASVYDLQFWWGRWKNRQNCGKMGRKGFGLGDVKRHRQERPPTRSENGQSSSHLPMFSLRSLPVLKGPDSIELVTRDQHRRCQFQVHQIREAEPGTAPPRLILLQQIGTTSTSPSFSLLLLLFCVCYYTTAQVPIVCSCFFLSLSLLFHL